MSRRETRIKRGRSGSPPPSGLRSSGTGIFAKKSYTKLYGY